MEIALSKAFESEVIDTMQSLPQHQQVISQQLVNSIAFMAYHCTYRPIIAVKLPMSYQVLKVL